MTSDEVLTLAALGRPFSLGMLYDRRKDIIVPGITLWNPDHIERYIKTESHPGCNYDLITTDTLKQKALCLDVDAELKLSLLGGMVEIDGAAKFINDRKSKTSQSRVSLKYRSTSHFKELTMEQLASHKITHEEIFERNIATHVVSGILYGANAFFVFDREVNEFEDCQKIQGHLQVLIKAIPGSTIGGHGKLRMDDTSTTLAKQITCRFYGDVLLPSNPTTFEEALTTYHQLPSYIEGHSVPIQIWLYPLSKLQNKAQKLVRDMNILIIKKIEYNIECLNDIQTQCNDLSLSNTCKYVPGIKNKIDTFSRLVAGYRERFQHRLLKILPKVRSFELEEKNLFSLVERQLESPFSAHLLGKWVSERRQEVKMLGTYVHDLENMQNIYITEDKADIAVKTYQHDNILLLKIVLPQQADQLLQQMSDAIESDKNEKYKENLGSQDWFQNGDVLKVMRKTVKTFIEIVAENKHCAPIFYMASFTEDGHMDVNKCAYMTFYRNGEVEYDNFFPPGTPGKPLQESVEEHSVTLKWDKPQNSEFVNHYDVSYRKASFDEWNICSTKDNKEFFEIRGLEENTDYEFKVRAVSLGGCCPYGEISNNMRTKESQGNLDDIRMVLIGPNGYGKSATGNTILQKKRFKTGVRTSSTTTHCELGENVFETPTKKYNLILVDTPGLEMERDYFRKEIRRCVHLASPGPHAILYVIQIRRFTHEDVDSIQSFKRLFGDRLMDYTVIVFTGGDRLEEDNWTIDQIVESALIDIKTFIEDCGNRYVVFNNKYASKDTQTKQVSTLIGVIEKMISRNSSYSNERLELEWVELRKRMEEL